MGMFLLSIGLFNSGFLFVLILASSKQNIKSRIEYEEKILKEYFKIS